MKLFKEAIKVNFYKTFFEQESIPELYSKIRLHTDEAPLKISFNPVDNIPNKKNVVIEYFPNYLIPEISKNYSKKAIFQKKGHAVNLKEFRSFEDYYSSHIKKSKRKLVTRSIKRLESCFDVSYKMYFGHIEKERYDILMEALFTMIRKRFETKHAKNEDLENQVYYKKMFYPLILEKRASLFVIYNKDKPIEISLNYNNSGICYSAICSFNMDYSKFSLGNVEIYQQIKWCFENNHTLFDMGYGDFNYKLSWSNLTYDFESHVLSQQMPSSFISNLLNLKYRLVNFIIKNNINTQIYKLKKDVAHLFSKQTKNVDYRWSKIESEPNLSPEGMELITDLEDKRYDSMRRYVYDFAYAQNARIDSIKIHQKSMDDYLIVFNNMIALLTKAKKP
ncbi:GNAT family N-acetyltransferase [Flagellimonas sp.]|uniref:GNAT family N-acetyltransferase n=1 Tax=Flagellimonas sp. TaxID=2058762 RepID=UPI003F49EBB6